MVNQSKFKGQRFCPDQGSNPVPPSSQPVVIAMSYNNPSDNKHKRYCNLALLNMACLPANLGATEVIKGINVRENSFFWPKGSRKHCKKVKPYIFSSFDKK